MSEFDIYLTNSLTRKKEKFAPIDAKHVKMYACGPTVYDRAHLGNARAATVYDLLFRLLKLRYENVTYVRNITDVDDKIINASKASGQKASEITIHYTRLYQKDMEYINCLPPTYEPKATRHIQDMLDMIEVLIEKGFAYFKEGHVLFAVSKYKDYGALARRSIDEMIAGARVEIAPYKEDPMDFVLWKPVSSDEYEYGFDSKYGRGRPGWHIECSAMSKVCLGDEFDIHGGGADLMFPHHENEIAQSVCATGHKFARYWVHNGFLMVEGQKMSKSLGNFKTVADMQAEGIDGAVIRYVYLSTHYRKPLDFSKKAIYDATKSLAKLQALDFGDIDVNQRANVSLEVAKMLADDLNTPALIAEIHTRIADFESSIENRAFVKFALDLLGIKLKEKEVEDIPDNVKALAMQRFEARLCKDFALADSLRAQLGVLGYDMLDNKDGYCIKKIH